MGGEGCKQKLRLISRSGVNVPRVEHRLLFLLTDVSLFALKIVTMSTKNTS